MRATASAISHDGLSRFDDIEAYLTVPNAPGDASNAGVQFLWCGLENLTSTGDWILRDPARSSSGATTGKSG